MTNRRAAIQPKAEDSSWVVVPNLWGGIISPPGFMKSPVISTITQPLTRVEALWRDEYESATTDYQQQREEAELRHAAWRERYKAYAKGGKDLPARPDNSLVVPTRRRLLTQDATFESLHTILSENPAGIMIIRDELTGWLAQLDSPGREGERAFYLSAWNGDTGHTIDRIGRGSIYVSACCVSMLGGIQPARLRPYLGDALRDGPANDGLIQRFQLAVHHHQRLLTLLCSIGHGRAIRIDRTCVTPIPRDFKLSPRASTGLLKSARRNKYSVMWDTRIKSLCSWAKRTARSHLPQYRALGRTDFAGVIGQA